MPEQTNQDQLSIPYPDQPSRATHEGFEIPKARQRGSTGEGSRADFPDDNGVEFGIQMPPTNTPEHEIFARGVQKARSAFENGSALVEEDQGLVIPELSDLQREELDKQQTFPAIANPKWWGYEAKLLTTDELSAVRLFDAEKISTDLFWARRNLQSHGPSVARYKDSDGKLVYVALASEEYRLVQHSPSLVADRVFNNTLESRRDDEVGTDILIPSEDLAAARRSSVHALESRISAMNEYAQKLEYDREAIRLVLEYVNHPQLVRLKGSNYMDRMVFLDKEVFGKMLRALSVQRNWTSEKQTRARQALTDRLLHDRSHNQHLKNWADTLTLADNYWGQKWALFKTKTAETKAELKIRKSLLQ